jgi:RNA polymerase sigma-70 factor (ECF subfamily)
MFQRWGIWRVKVGRSAHDWDWAEVTALCLRESRRLLGGTNSAAEDAAQEATIRAWRHRARCRDPARPEPWIAAIARREALRALARRRELPLEARGDIADPRQDLSDLPDLLAVRRALSAVDGRDRQLLVGHYWQDLPNAELATQLGLAEVTVRVRLHRLRRLLREIMVEV